MHLLHIPYNFLVRVENEIQIVNIEVYYNKVFACSAVKIFKNKPLRNFKQGGLGASPMRRRWIRICGLWKVYETIIKNLDL